MALIGKKTAQRVAGTLNKWSDGAVAEAFREAKTAYDDDPRATEYRRLSQANRDLYPFEFDKAARMSFTSWQRNPLARRLIEIMTDFTAGEEFAVTVKIMQRTEDEDSDNDTEREDAQKIWDDFATHPVNRFYDDFSMFVQDLLINGELCFPTTVNAKREIDGGELGDGGVMIGYIDPLNIKEVITMPDNVRQVEALSLAAKNADPIIKSVVRYDTKPESPTYGKLVGEILFWRINRVVNQTRGHGELIELLDWLDGLDQFLFDALQAFRVRNAFYWDVTAIGADDAQVNQLAKTVTPPKTGRVRVHNDKILYDAKAPTLGSVEVETALLSFQTFVVGTKGFPIMWFGSGADTNRATAAEMGVPTMRMLKAFQSEIKRFVKYVCQFVLDQAELAGSLKLSENEYCEITVDMYDFERADAAVIGAGFQQIVAALTLAQDNAWLSPETAKRIIDGFVQRFGVEPDDVDQDEIAQSKQEDEDETDPLKLYKGLEEEAAAKGKSNGEQEQED